jgi:hypothetical protein
MAIQDAESDDGWLSGTLADFAEEFGYASESDARQWLRKLERQRVFEIGWGDAGVVYVRMLARGYKLARRLLPAAQ